jgi:hypothetical protein
MSDLADFHQKRFIGALKAMVELLGQHNVEKWADWFEGDLTDYLAAQGPPRQITRQQAALEHVLMAFGGMSTFTRLRLSAETAELRSEANERLEFLSTQLWAAARSMQGVLASAETASSDEAE